jgi:hypothetical protein
MERTGNPALGPVAADVRRRLATVVEAVKP